MQLTRYLGFIICLSFVILTGCTSSIVGVAPIKQNMVSFNSSTDGPSVLLGLCCCECRIYKDAGIYKAGDNNFYIFLYKDRNEYTLSGFTLSGFHVYKKGLNYIVECQDDIDRSILNLSRLKTFKLISSRNSISSPIILISVEKAPYILFRFIPTSTYKENNFAEVSSGKVDIKILEDTKQLSSLYSFISEILKIVPENRIADFVNEYYFQEFSKLDLHSMETLIEHFQNVSIKKQLLSLYLKKFSKNKHSQELVTKLVNQDGVKPYYEFLKKSGYIKIPNFGTFEITDIDKLKQKINEFFKTFDFSIFSKGGNFSYKIDYPNSPKNRNVIIDYYLDDQKMFSINALAHCKMYAKKREKGHRYKGFFIFTTVVYDSMFEIKQYECKLFQKDIDKITTIFSLLESRLCKNKTVQLKSKWNFSVKKWLYDISAKQTAFGKLMSDAFSGGSGEAGCYEVYNECKKNCKLKNDKNGFFIFTSSDKDKCENYCIDAKISCEKGRKQEMRENICRAKCVGYNNGNGGFFSSSDYEKCMHRCLK